MNRFLAAVNQKRLFARLLLDRAQESGGQRHLEQALLQGAVTHLRLAVQFYLCEVAAAYQCRDAVMATSPGALATLLAEMDKTPGEVSEILTLSGEGHSWLNHLFSCHQTISLAPDVMLVRHDDANHISAVTAPEGEDWSLIGCEQVEGWLTAFDEMVDRHRGVMVEC